MESSESTIRRKTQLTTPWPNEKGQTGINKTLHRKLKIEQHKPHYTCTHCSQ